MRPRSCEPDSRSVSVARTLQQVQPQLGRVEVKHMTSLDSLGTSRLTGRIEHGKPVHSMVDADLAMDETIGCATAPAISEPSAAHDPSLLVAALDEIEARRAALQWLLEAELLCLCVA
jgi:hypothetical protein